MGNVIIVRIGAVALCILVGLPAESSAQDPNSWTHQIGEGSVLVRIDAARGGAITFLGVHQGSVFENAVNNGDYTGRQLQSSLYAGLYDSCCWPCNNTCYWGWNPVQAGSACQVPSGGSVVEHTGTRLVAVTTPRQWNNLQGKAAGVEPQGECQVFCV